MTLSENDKLFIKNNHSKLSLRQMAKKLDQSRLEINKYILTLSGQRGVSHESFVERIPKLFLAAALFFLTFLTFSNSLFYDFVWDDAVQIQQNASIKSLSLQSVTAVFKVPIGEAAESVSYRPIQTLTYLITHHIFLLNPMAYHLTNVLLQCFASVLLFFLLVKLIDNKTIAFWVSAFFSIHPVQIAAVTYISGRAESLALIFMLISFYAFTRSLITVGFRRLLTLTLSAILFGLAILTKELFIITPILFYVYYRNYKTANKLTARWFHFAAYGLTLGAYLIIRLNVLRKIGQGAIGSLSLHDRITAAFLVIPHYLRLLINPSNLHMAYQFPREYLSFSNPVVMIGILSTVFFCVLVFFQKKIPVLSLGFAWFCLFLLPVLNIFVLLNGPMAEHWLYNASIGFFIILISLIFTYGTRNYHVARCVDGVLGTLVLIYAVTTYHSNEIWKNEILLFQSTVKYVQNDPSVYCNLGTAYAKQGMAKEAEESFRKALEIDPHHKNALYNLNILRRHNV